MNCGEAKLHLYTFLDGETSVYRRWKIRRHLRACPPCEHGFVFERKLKVRVAEGCREEIPRELEQRLRAFLRMQDDGTEG